MIVSAARRGAPCREGLQKPFQRVRREENRLSRRERYVMLASTDVARTVRRWLRTFEAHVRAVDFTAARAMFAPDVVAFGTYATVVTGRAALERRQWSHVWPAITGFKFRLGELRCLGGPRGVCVVVPWESRGVREDGTTFARPGRATLFLVRSGGRWVALHSHFSLAPARAPRRAAGRRPRSQARRASR